MKGGNITPFPAPKATDPNKPVSPEFSDDALALEFVEKNARELRYVAKWGAWLRWSGSVWAEDSTLSVFDAVRRLCRSAALEANTANKKIASKQTVAAVEFLSRSDSRVAAVTDQWDANPFLLNTPDGTLDLRTAEERPSNWADFITKTTSVSPGGGCPQFIAFLGRITGGDKELQAYLQRVFGYALTGSTQEQAMFFFYGTGANGKSTLLEVMSGIMADYFTGAAMETFVASRTDRHPTELAKLRGARLVAAVETDEGRRWSESRIKALAGGDVISARFMRGDYFDYRPEFKLIIAGNNKPRMKTVDEEMRRRFNLVPFAVTIPKDERDPELGEKLKTEWPGILQWTIEGCIDWRERGSLAPPKCVVEATAEYLDSEDTMATWLAECCDVDRAKTDNSTTLYRSWKAWADRSNEYCGSQKGFSQKLQARGFEKDGTRTGAQFIGVATRAQNRNWRDA